MSGNISNLPSDVLGRTEGSITIFHYAQGLYKDGIKPATALVGMEDGFHMSFWSLEKTFDRSEASYITGCPPTRLNYVASYQTTVQNLDECFKAVKSSSKKTQKNEPVIEFWTTHIIPAQGLGWERMK
ncbi:hypothetical protein MACH10_11750 [Thalassospira tepidiphila]|uniref:hypothetical protein n=1 Tax=Thalassospira tepidiphila TaxID=393657 RepID=UPI0029201E00|nr:hypothetical protein MACH10_11750 [Thalassospira tepidiphila]